MSEQEKKLAVSVIVQALKDIRCGGFSKDHLGMLIGDAADASQFFFGEDDTMLSFWCDVADVHMDWARRLAKKQVRDLICRRYRHLDSETSFNVFSSIVRRHCRMEDAA